MEIINGVPHSYLGDGLYAKYDGLGIWLMANDHKEPTDKVYLEPSVHQAFLRFIKDLRRQYGKEVMG